MRRLNRQTMVPMLQATLASLFGVIIGAVLVLWLRPTPLAPIIMQVNLATPMPTTPPPTDVVPPPEPTPLPATPTFVALPSDTISLEIITLRQDLQRTVGSVRLLQAASRLQQARLAVRDNDLDAVQRQLTIAQEQLDAATPLVSDDIKANVQGINNDINYVRDDIPVRPETLESRIMALWEQVMVFASAQ